ncbi:SGNH hydrolase domain-containing protein [Undibacterium sp. SXout20W]|uniref:SGNH hydrolase domain-containing protein n=1 Tax=Undibacterium sp. SXout20W TaxID=3413051 RepID=UPI003BF41768
MKKYGLTGFIRYCKLTSEQPSIAIIGDSHASMLFYGVAEALKNDERGVVNLGGRLFVDVATYPIGNTFEMDVYRGGIQATKFVAQEKTIDTVVLASRAPSSFDTDDHNVFALISDPTITDRKRVWEIGLRKTLDQFYGTKKEIIFFLDIPDLDFDPYLCVRPLSLSSKKENCAVPAADYRTRFSAYRGLVESVLKDYPKVKVFDAAAYLCDQNWCRARVNGAVAYGDRDHLSVEGSRYIGNELARVLNGENSKIYR